MKRLQKRRAGMRAAVIFGAATILLSGVTYASMQSQNDTLQGNTIMSATANLQILGANGIYADTAPGFTFSNLEPGGAAGPTPGNHISLKNTGTTTLALKIAMNATSYSNPQQVNINKVTLIFTPVGGGATFTTTLATLCSGYNSGTPIPLNMFLPAGQTQDFTVQAQLAADAVTSTTTGFTLSGVDLIFSGNAVVN